MLAAFRIELIKTNGTFTAIFPYLGIAFSLLSIGFSALASGQDFTTTPYAWHGVYSTGLMAPLCAVLVASCERREAQAQRGGLDYRPISPLKLRVARWLVLALSALGFQVLSFAPLLLFGAGPQTGLVAGLSWLGMLGPLGIFALVARVGGLAPTLLFSVLWQVVAVWGAGSQYWFLCPPAWAVRVILVPMNVNPNLTPLAADSPLKAENPLLGILLCCLLAGVGLWCCLFAPRLRRRGFVKGSATRPASMSLNGGHNARSVRRLPTVLPTLLSWRRSGIYPLSISSLILLVLVRWNYSPSAAAAVFTYMVLPMGVFLLVVISWGVAKPTLWQHCCQSQLANWDFVGAHLSLIVVLIFITTVIVQPRGYTVLLWLGTSIGCLLLALALVMRLGSGAVLVAGLVMTVFSLVIGGDVLADTPLWVVAFTAWPAIVHSTSQFLIALCLTAWVIVITGLLLRRSLRHYLAHV